jgi:putative drug exporter of the RND superfamily
MLIQKLTTKELLGMPYDTLTPGTNSDTHDRQVGTPSSTVRKSRSGKSPSRRWDLVEKCSTRYALVVIVLWLGAAVAGTFVAPLLEKVATTHTQAMLPADAPSIAAALRIGEEFQDGKSTNTAYLLLESDHELGPLERQFYSDIVAKLQASPQTVDSIMDLWSDPRSAQTAESKDKKASYTLLRLKGQLGGSDASNAISKVREIVAGQNRPPGLNVYVAGPGAMAADGFEAVDKQMTLITGATVVVIAILLFSVYRSVITAAVPLLTVGLALGASRGAISVLGDNGIIEISIFSVALMSTLVLGAATDYAIFFMGRYHELRRSGIPHDEALTIAYRSVAPVVAASGLTVSVALACLNFAHVVLLRSAGTPCAIGVFLGMLASLTLLPAIVSVAGRRGLVQPRPTKQSGSKSWRRTGAVVARWPLPVAVAAALFLLCCMIPTFNLRLGYNELAAQPSSTGANLGLAAMNRHFPPNELFPEFVVITTDHDLRNPAGVLAIEQLTRQIVAIQGVVRVQSVSRPAGTVPDAATVANQAGKIGDQLDEGLKKLEGRLETVDQLKPILNRFSTTVDQLEPILNRFSTATSELENSLAAGVGGLGQLNSGVDGMRTGLQGMRATVEQVSEHIEPIRDFTNGNPNCANDLICSMGLKLVQPIDSLRAATAQLTDGASNLGTGARSTAGAFRNAEDSVGAMHAAAAQLNTIVNQFKGTVDDVRTLFSKLTDQLKGTADDVKTLFSNLTDYLKGMRNDFAGSGEGFYLPARAWQNPQFQRAASLYFSPDGRSTRLLVYSEKDPFGSDGTQQSPAIENAIREATKQGTLAGGSVASSITGTDAAIANLRTYSTYDYTLLAIVAFALVYLILLVMLKSPVAATVVIGSVAVSYISAIGASKLIWHDLLGQNLHWAVPPLALIVLVAVGADYNLFFSMRLREEVSAHTKPESARGVGTAIIRTFEGTGRVVTAAGMVFGITMFSMLFCNVLSLRQIGTTIGMGLIIDTLIVRTFLVPGVAGLLKGWFWWSPPGFVFRPFATRFQRLARKNRTTRTEPTPTLQEPRTRLLLSNSQASG